MKKDDCIFCKLANGDIPTRKIYEDDSFTVIMDANPASKGHSLILPKEHYANIYEIPEEVCGEVMKLAKKLAVKMTDALHADGFNIVQNNGEAAGQTVFHYHCHLIPRYQGGPSMVSWRPNEISGEELDKIRDIITGE